MQTREFWDSLWSWHAFAVYGAWYFWTVACWFALPGKEMEGELLRNGKRLTYTMNGELVSEAFTGLGHARRSTMELTLRIGFVVALAPPSQPSQPWLSLSLSSP